MGAAAPVPVVAAASLVGTTLLGVLLLPPSWGMFQNQPSGEPGILILAPRNKQEFPMNSKLVLN